MTEITAKLKYLRMSPRKVRLVADMVRGADADIAKAKLRFSKKGASAPLLTLLNSAVSNAANNFKKKEGLYIKKIFVDQGPTYKRFRPAARGVAAPISKKTSHITIVLDEKHVS